jgi:CMP-N-acetylneuraminic acid synthetase/quercetin dioxygenase-like cupin family protein
MKIICMIPARLNSSRIKQKNLRFLGEKPLVSHVIDTVVNSGLFSEVFLNSEADIFREIAMKHKINFFERDKGLAEGNVTNDLFMHDFLKRIDCDYVVQVNTTSPFITENDISSVINLLVNEGYDTVQSIKIEQIEGLFEEKPLNFIAKHKMPQSQDLKPIQLYSSGIMGFRRDRYLKNMIEFNSATYGPDGNIGYHIMTGYSKIDIDWEEDFNLAECIYKSLSDKSNGEPRYYCSDNSKIYDKNREQILVMDGVKRNNMHDFNKEVTHIPEIINRNSKSISWSHTLVDSPSNSATLIAQMPGEGNRLHYHPNWDEWWFIIEGEWEWTIENKIINVKKGDHVWIQRNKKHRIKAVGEKMAIRLAVSRHDVDHIYSPTSYK